MTRHEGNLNPEWPESPEREAFARAVLDGLSAPHKRLPCQYFYDARGSRLFEEITRLEEYYPTRTETAILRDHAASMVETLEPGSVVVEFGSGSSRKTELLLAALRSPRAYVPIDVSEAALEGARRRLERQMPELAVFPTTGDFCDGVALPEIVGRHPKLGFFPGSTIGNFEPDAAIGLLAHFGTLLGPESRLIIGADLDKDARRLIAAYNDAKGVTAEFNLNILRRINRELAGTFELARFQHVAIYDETRRRIEMHLVSLTPQMVRVRDHTFEFEAGETIHTENSYKYSVESFQTMARQAGWQPLQVWLDAARDFSVHALEFRPSAQQA